MLVTGDAAALCYTNGLNLEGMNLAIASGFLAAEAVIGALQKGDFSSRQLSEYEERLRKSFVLKDMKTFEKAVDWMHTDRLFSAYPRLVASIMEQIFASDGKPRRRLGRIGWETIRDTVTLSELVADLIKGGRSFL